MQTDATAIKDPVEVLATIIPFLMSEPPLVVNATLAGSERFNVKSTIGFPIVGTEGNTPVSILPHLVRNGAKITEVAEIPMVERNSCLFILIFLNLTNMEVLL